VGMALVCLAIAAMAACGGCSSEKSRREKENRALQAARERELQIQAAAARAREAEAEAAQIEAVLAVLFEESRAATERVEVNLPDGGTTAALRRRPLPIAKERTPALPARLSPLEKLASPVRIALDSPAAFDWAPGAEGKLIAANKDGIWVVDAETSRVTQWIPPEKNFTPQQVLSRPRGWVLFAQPGRAAAARWPGEGELIFAPPQVRLNYAAWNPRGDKVVCILEYLHFGSPVPRLGMPDSESEGAAAAAAESPEAIRIEAAEWNPATGAVEPLREPPLGSMAWVAGDTTSGRWIGLAKAPGQFDPFPAALLAWNAEARAWAPASAAGEWTDAAPSSALVAVRGSGTKGGEENGAVRSVWIRRQRPRRQAGRPWMQASAASGGEKRAWEKLGARGAIPLSENDIERIAVSPGGEWLAFSMPASGAAGESKYKLQIAPAEEVGREAAHLNLAARETERRAAEAQFVESLLAPWKSACLAPAGQGPLAPESAKALRALDAAFADAARKAFGINPDHTLASLAELDDCLDHCGSALDGEEAAEAVSAALGAYYGETLAQAAGAQWELTSWPPDVAAPEQDISSTDDFLYTLHAPFSAAARAVSERMSLAEAARQLATEWPRPIFLVNRPATDSNEVLRRLLGDAANAPEMQPNPAPDITKTVSEAEANAAIRAWLDSFPQNQWVILGALLEPNAGRGDKAAKGAQESGNRKGNAAKAAAGHTPLWMLAAALAHRRPESPRAFVLLGQTFGAAEQTRHALAAHLQAARMDPASAEFAVAVARAALDDAQFDLAAQWFLAARRLDADGRWRDVINAALEGLGAQCSPAPPNHPFSPVPSAPLPAATPQFGNHIK